MRGLQKSKRLSWASDVNLCQVRLFLSDESPCQVGLGTQDHLQAKASWLSPPTGMGADDNLPPGFEGAQPANLWMNKLSQIPLIKWRSPPIFVLDFTWQVVAGEESKEVEIQNQREMRVLEAVYPRPSAIPPNPSLLMGIEDSSHNDFSAPLIPITPVEDEDAAADTPVNPTAQITVPMSSQSSQLAPSMPPASHNVSTNYPNPTANGNGASGIFPGVEPDVAAAAYAALTAIMASNDRGSLIDQDLLIKILSDQNLMEKLITDHRAAANPQTSQTIPMSRPPVMILSEPPPIQTSRAETFYTQPNRVGLVSNIRPPPPPLPPPPPPPPEAIPMAKDINYYKSLIQQHGGERQESLPQFGRPNQEPVNSTKPRDPKPKIMKPCIYFNSSRGCRHGSNCSYQHNVSSQQRASSMPEAQSAKRMKLDREITGA